MAAAQTTPEPLKSGGAMAKLTQDEIGEFLSRPLVAHLTTLRPDGTPHSAPVWFLWDAGRGMPGQALVMAYDKAVKVRNIGGNPAVALSVATPERPYAFVTLEGRASLDPAAVAEACHRICEKYDGPQRGPEYARELLADGDMTLIAIAITRLISWKDDSA